MRDYQRQLQTLRDQIAQREEDLAVLFQLYQHSRRKPAAGRWRNATPDGSRNKKMWTGWSG